MDEGLKNNLDLKIDRYNTEIAKHALGAAYGVYDPAFSFRGNYRYDDVPSYFAPDKLNQDFPWKGDTTELGPAITGKLPTGLGYVLGASAVSLDHIQTDFRGASDFVPFGGKYPNNGIRDSNFVYLSSGLTVQQPLLKNAWIDANRETIQINKKNSQISDTLLRGEVMRIITAVQLAYFELSFARENVRVQETALTTAQQFLDETTKRLKAGDRTDLDVKQAKSQLETIKTDLLSAQQLYLEQQNVLKQLLSSDFNLWRNVEIVTTDRLIALPDRPDQTEMWQNALTKRADILQMKLELERQNIVVKFNKNQLYPTLDIVGNVGMRSGSADWNTALSDLGEFNHPTYGGGLIFSIPFTRKTEKENYALSKAVQQQAILRMKRLEQLALVEVDTTAKVLESAYSRVASTRVARETAEQVLQAEEKKLVAGSSTSFFVLEYQSKLTAARSQEMRALADYNKARSQLALSEGITLEKNQISLDIK